MQDERQCPNCKGSYLHQKRVTVYERNEDAKQTTVTEVSRKGTDVSTWSSSETGNPSDRRQGLAILFECEDCPAWPELTLAQHKGWTLVSWRITEPCPT
jgi:hypothetical protein